MHCTCIIVKCHCSATFLLLYKDSVGGFGLHTALHPVLPSATRNIAAIAIMKEVSVKMLTGQLEAFVRQVHCWVWLPTRQMLTLTFFYFTKRTCKLQTQLIIPCQTFPEPRKSNLKIWDVKSLGQARNSLPYLLGKKWFLMDWTGSVFASISMQIIKYLWILAQGRHHGTRTLLRGHLQETKKRPCKQRSKERLKKSHWASYFNLVQKSWGIMRKTIRHVRALCFLQRSVTQKHEQTVNSNPGPFSVCASLFVHAPQLRGRDYRWLAVLCPADDHRWSDIWHGPDQRGCGQCE